MSQVNTFSSPEAVHRHFSTFCFNHTWDLLEKPDRTAAENEEMIQTSLASLWHWNQRSDCTDRERSIGTWQVSRVCAVVGLGEISLHYARQALEYAQDLQPFYKAYAYEALARAQAVRGNLEEARQYLDQAAELIPQVKDARDRKALEEDLKTIILP